MLAFTARPNSLVDVKGEIEEVKRSAKKIMRTD
jgi:hypothetical protein